MIGTQEASAPLDALYRWHQILIVDDDPETLAALRRELQREPYDVITSQQPQLALEWLERKRISLVISDQRMPAMEGDQLLERVWNLSPGTGRLLLTGYPESLRKIPPSRRSLLQVMIKPWEGRQLKRKIREMLHDQEGWTKEGDARETTS